MTFLTSRMENESGIAISIEFPHFLSRFTKRSQIRSGDVEIDSRDLQML